MTVWSKTKQSWKYFSAHFDASPRQALHYQPNNVGLERKMFFEEKLFPDSKTIKEIYKTGLWIVFLFTFLNVRTLRNWACMGVWSWVLWQLAASGASVCATRDRWDITRKPIPLTCQTSFFKILAIWAFVKVFFLVLHNITFRKPRESGPFPLKYFSRYWNEISTNSTKTSYITIA